MPHSLRTQKFLLFGDSITEFSYDPTLSFSFGSALTNDYVRKLDVVNRGFAGYQSRWGLKLLPRILEQEQDVRMATMFFGTNDAVEAGPQHVDLEEYKSNITTMVGMFKEKNIKVILISPGFHGEEPWEERNGGFVQYSRTTEMNKEYSTALKEIAKKHQVGFVDTFALFEEFEKTYTGELDVVKELLLDGVHFTGKAYRLIYDELKIQIGKHYPELLPENLSMGLPYWRDVVEEEL